MLSLGIYLYYKDWWILNELPLQHTWVPIACILLYTVACTMGFLVVPWVMIGEVYPTQVFYKKFYITLQIEALFHY